MNKIEQLIEELGKLTVIEAGELSKKLEETWGVTAVSMAPQTAKAVNESPVGAPKKFIVTGFNEGKKITVIKKIKEVLGLGLLEAKNYVENLPKTVKEDLTDEDAKKMLAEFEEVGGTGEIK